MNPREVPCPTCEAPSGSSCGWYHGRTFIPTGICAARKRAAERLEAVRDETAQRLDWENDGGVD